MALFKSDTEKYAEKVQEEKIYAFVADEIAQNKMSPGHWAKAVAESGGDPNKAQAEYIKIRVDMMKATGAAMHEFKDAVIEDAAKKSKPVQTYSQPSYRPPEPTAKPSTLRGAIIGAVGGLLCFIFTAFNSSSVSEVNLDSFLIFLFFGTILGAICLRK